jgi:7-cyano-7-deazaguanine synthase
VAKLASGTLAGRKSEKSTEYFPSRNLFLLALAAMYAHSLDIDTIMLGLSANSSELFPDTSPTYLTRVRNVLRLEYPNISVKAPFIEEEKTEVVSAASELGLLPELTFSCNRLEKRHCWDCSSCADRLRVFEQLDIV